jgi:hypothetical protein
MKDFLNQDINLGDMVVYSNSSRYGRLSGPYEVGDLSREFSSKTIGILKNNRFGRTINPSYVSNNRLIVVSKLLP